ncbi:MAG: 4-hydroxythreonine-4-phosphate dehydrogenase PdxA, partial [Chlorobiales bacterium]|nr:4-hydroxythreonine-4-phosphate dehydrogenase PdxA [Chlorobiales bacterium]
MTILWTIGDPNGIGPEIILNAFSKLAGKHRSEHTFAVVGSYKAMLFYRDRLKIPIELVPIESIDELELLPEQQNTLAVLDVGTAVTPSPGTLSGSAGALAMEAIELATNL